MTKIVYTYHPETKELIGKDTAYESPLEKGTFMMPANSTIKEPIFEPGKITKWVDENWVLEDIPELPLPPEPTVNAAAIGLNNMVKKTTNTIAHLLVIKSAKILCANR